MFSLHSDIQEENIMRLNLFYLFAFCPHDEYREPFVGGGAFSLEKKKKYNWLNDLEKNIIQTYKTIADPELIGWLVTKVVQVATKERHTEMKNFKPSSPEEVSYKTYYLNRTSYSGIIYKPAWGYALGRVPARKLA